MAKRRKLGDCFEAALLLLIGHHKHALLLGDVELVHGYVTG